MKTASEEDCFNTLELVAESRLMYRSLPLKVLTEFTFAPRRWVLPAPARNAFEETGGAMPPNAVQRHLQIAVNEHRVSRERLPGPY